MSDEPMIPAPTDDADFIRRVCREVAGDPTQSGQARIAAGRTLAEMQGLLRQRTPAEDDGDGVPLHEMSAADLYAAAAENRVRLGNLKALVAEATSGDVVLEGDNMSTGDK